MIVCQNLAGHRCFASLLSCALTVRVSKEINDCSASRCVKMPTYVGNSSKLLIINSYIKIALENSGLLILPSPK